MQLSYYILVKTVFIVTFDQFNALKKLFRKKNRTDNKLLSCSERSTQNNWVKCFIFKLDWSTVVVSISLTFFLIYLFLISALWDCLHSKWDMLPQNLA